ncbi:MAG: hypothetical protein ACK4SY_08900 [Pyrobaculum sp.]
MVLVTGGLPRDWDLEAVSAALSPPGRGCVGHRPFGEYPAVVRAAG